MRITFITLKIDIVRGGGANRGLDIKLRALQRLGHEVRLLTLFPELNALPAEGVPYPVEPVPPVMRTFNALQRHVVELLRANETQTDIYNIDGTSCLWAGGMYRQEGGTIPVVAYLATYMEALDILTPELPDPQNGLMPWLKLFIELRSVWIKNWIWSKVFGLPVAQRLDAIFVPAPVVGDIYAQFGFPKQRIAVLSEFIDRSHFHVERTRSEPYPLQFTNERPFRILHVGRLLRMKGVDLVIQAVAGARRRGRHVTLTVLGDGPQRARLEALIDRLDITNAVTFLPWKEESDLSSSYAACDAFVHPCRFPEPLGRTIIEAMFFGRPIITSAGSGSAWAAGEAGATAKQGDAKDLERVICELHDHPERLKEMSRHTSERVAFFDHEAWARTFVTQLEQIRATSR
jgi:glycosyltransferase involved in cell wall biosynthesis